MANKNDKSQEFTCFMDDLEHKSPSLRRKAIRNISSWLENPNNTDHLTQTVKNKLSSKIMQFIVDQSESIREAALHLLLQLISACSATIDYKKLIPIIWAQLGCRKSMDKMIKFKKNDTESDDDFKTFKCNEMKDSSQPEASEEVRKLMVKLLNHVILDNSKQFTTFFEIHENRYCLQFLNILHLLFNDKCPEIQTLICQLLLDQIKAYEHYKANISYKLFKYIFDDYAEYLCLSLSKGCMHQRGKIRFICFQLLSEIIRQNIIIHHKVPPWMTDDDKIWKYIFHLTFDRMPYIKQALVTNAFSWISSLTNTDRDDSSLICYAKIWMLLLNESGYAILKQSSIVNTERELLTFASDIITLCQKEISHWQVSHRLLGIKAVFQLIVCLETKFPSKYMLHLLPHFVPLMESQEEEIRMETNKCLQLFGKYIPMEQYLDFLFSRLTDNISLKAYLKIATQIFSGYEKENINETKLAEICQSLSNVLQDQMNMDAAVDMELLAAITSLLQVTQFNSDSTLIILWLIVQIHARYLERNYHCLSQLNIDSTHPLHEAIQHVINILIKDKDVYHHPLWNQSFKSLFEIVDVEIKRGCGQYLFAVLVYYYRDFIVNHMDLILPIFQQMNDENSTETLREATLSILYSLIQNISNGDKWRKYTESIVIEMLLPNICWKIGKFRFRMRLLAMKCMISLYEKESVNAMIIWHHRDKIISTLQSRLDDFQSESRGFAIQLLRYVFNDLQEIKQNKSDAIIQENELETLCQAILDGFEDSNNENRIFNCSSLKAFCQCLDKKNVNLYAKIIEASLIHLDDENDTIQKNIFQLLKDISSFNKQVFEQQLQSVDMNIVQQETATFIKDLMTFC